MDIIAALTKLKEIVEFSKVVFSLNQSNDSLFNYLDSVDANTKKELFEKYRDSEGVVLSLRKKVGEQFIAGPINRVEIESLFQKGKKENPTRFTVYKNLFSILYPFITNRTNDEVYKFMHELASQLQVDLQLKEFTEIKINGFDGSRNTGDTHAWFAIYNNSHPNQKTAVQLFFSIQKGKVSCALYDRKNDNFIETQEVSLNETYYQNILNFYRKYSDQILKDNYRSELLSKYDIPRLIEQIRNGEAKGWLIKPGKKASLWKEALNSASIFIGWGSVIKDAMEADNYSNEFIIQKLNEHYPKDNTDNQSNNRVSIQSFINEVAEGDLIFATSGRSDVIGFGIVTSGILNDEEEEDFSAYHTVDWLLDLIKKPYNPPYSLPIKTVTQLDGASAIDIIRELFNIKVTIPSVNKSMETLNQILYGPPGTGKTYNSIDKAVKIAAPEKHTGVHRENKVVFDELRKDGQIEFITFHQNYTYEDFMVGIKPNVTHTELQFQAHLGIFYKLCYQARRNYEASKARIGWQPMEELIQEMLSKITDDQPLEFKTITGKPFWLYDYNENTIYLRKSNGSEKHTLSISTIIEISEFNRQLVSGLSVYYNPIVEYLKKNRKQASANVELKSYVLVIDEINRANISRVFGELITLLEPDKRLGGENELRITLPNGEKDFAIPPNLYIIGTMNTADKSIALVDIALRRRFEFEGKYPDYTAIKDTQASELLRKINKTVFEKKKSADYLIGHAYFINHTSIENVLERKVIPLLSEYFMGRTDFVKEVFNGTGWIVDYNTDNFQWVIKYNGTV